MQLGVAFPDPHAGDHGIGAQIHEYLLYRPQIPITIAEGFVNGTGL